MALKLANNAATTLAAALNSTGTSVSLKSGTGLLFPVLAAGDWFPATILKANGEFEIVRATARSTDTLTITRAQEGTAAKSFAVGERIELRMTTAALNSIITDVLARLPLSGGAMTGALSIAGALSATTVTSTGAIKQGANQVWHAGNLTPANYLPLAGGTVTALTVQSATPTVNMVDTNGITRALHANDNMIGFLNTSGTWSMYSQNDGALIAAGNVAAYSDAKHKADVRSISGALALVEQLRGVRYTDKRTGADRIGVIAQEVATVFPQVVGRGPDGLHVDYGNLVGPLIEAVKELAAEVRTIHRGL